MWEVILIALEMLSKLLAETLQNEIPVLRSLFLGCE